MSQSQGSFVWYELMTPDAAAASAFYQAVIGWRARDAGAPHEGYTILSAGEVGVAGLVEMPASVREGGWTPGWVGYVGVDDVDAFAKRVIQAGGSVRRGPEDISGIGRFAYVTDPQAAALTLFTPLGGGMMPDPAGATPGRIGWHELHAADRETAFTFYADLFGWTKGEAIDMGPMGMYQIFAIGAGGPAMAGGMMTKSDPASAPTWLYYINVDATEAAVTRIKAAGGQVLQGPMQVPGGSWIAQCRDPQGVMFAVVGPAT